jgi:hypothetical protein
MASVTSAGRRVSLPVFGALLGVSLVLGACNLGAATPQGDDSAGGGAYATSQGSLRGVSGGEEARGLADCADLPLMFDMTAGGTKVHLEVEGRVQLNVDDDGEVSSSGASGIGLLSGTTKDGCTIIASWDYTATVFGTCEGSLMEVTIQEVFGKGGTISGTITCPKKKPKPWTFPWGVMVHPDSSFQLWLDSKGRLDAPPYEIPWGIGGDGFKRWTLYSAP